MAKITLVISESDLAGLSELLEEVSCPKVRPCCVADMADRVLESLANAKRS